MCPLWTILRNQKVKVCHHSNWKFWDKYCQSCCIARRPPFVCTNWIGSEAIAQISYNASWKIETFFFSTQYIFSCQPSQKSDNPARHPWACVSRLETSFVVAKAKVVLQKKKKSWLPTSWLWTFLLPLRLMLFANKGSSSRASAQFQDFMRFRTKGEIVEPT